MTKLSSGPLRDFQHRETFRDSDLLDSSAEAAHLRFLLAHGSDIVALLEGDGEIRYISPSVERLLGYTPDELVGISAFDLIHPEDSPAVVAAFDRAIRTPDTPQRVEYRIRHSDDSWRPHEAVGTGMLHEPAARGIVVNFREISERREAEAALRKSEERFQIVAALTHDAIWEVNPATGQVSWNAAFEAIFGGSADNLDAWGERIHPDDRERVLSGFDGVLARGEPVWRDEYRFRYSDGTYAHVYDRARAIYDEEGRPIRMIGAMMDITERKRAEENVREATSSFQDLFDSLTELVYIQEPDGQFINVNDAVLRAYGYSREEIVGATPTLLADTHRFDPEELAESLRRAMDGETLRFEWWGRRKNGDVFPKEVVLTKARYFGRNVLLAVARDISERKEAEAKLAAAEAHYRRLVENAPYAVYALDREGRFTELNHASAEILGRAPAELIGRAFTEIVAPEDLPKAAESFRRKFTGEIETSDLEVRLVHASGEYRLVHLRATLIRQGGYPVGTHGIARDITEERAQQEEMQLLAAALEGLEEGISIARADGQIIYANSTHARLLGYDRGHSPLPNAFDFMSDEERHGIEEILRIVAEEGTWAGRVRRRRLDTGQVIPLEMIIGRTDRPEGESLIFTIARDVTEEIARQQHLRRTERLASVGTLIGGVAHELNNPLHAIRNFAELMLLDGRDEDDRESLEIMKREADRAAKVVSDLRLIARQTQEGEGAREAVDLNDIIHHVLKVRRYALETGNVEIQEDLAEGLPPVLANRGEIEQVILNLMVNAEQAMARQNKERRLILRTRRTSRGAAAHIVDSGPGIPPQHLERIYDPFWTTKAPGEGTGLGLSLVHSIVTEHGGEIYVDSEPGKGTAFRIDLPCAPSEEGPTREEGAPAAPPRPFRILVVDDEDAIRRVMVRFLTRLGHHPDAAAEGEEALRLLEETDYDVILSDLRMPGLGGEELFHRLRERGDGREHRLIFVTGDAASSQATRVVSEASVRVLVKPVGLEELARAVEYAVREREAAAI